MNIPRDGLSDYLEFFNYGLEYGVFRLFLPFSYNVVYIGLYTTNSLMSSRDLINKYKHYLL